MKTTDFDYYLPPEFIAQTPIAKRDQSRLLVLNKVNGTIMHRKFIKITDYLCAGDVLLFNDSRVIPARLTGRKVETGGKVEILLLRWCDYDTWEALVKHSKRINLGTKIEIISDNEYKVKVFAEVVGENIDGIKKIKFSDGGLLHKLGRIPLPPYIHTPLDCSERYQTVYANRDGSVAAPTAGLHFTPELLDEIQKKGIHCLFVTLHIGLDTFRPIRVNDPLKHPIHREYGVIKKDVTNLISQAKAEGHKVICVGTTTARIVEHAAQNSHSAFLEPFVGWVDLFILPGYHFRVVDSLITNFHLPKSTLLMLVSAFAGTDSINRAYQEAIAEKYRFYSFGDVMLIQ
ncbi:MAG: tRNA preQ1(34) S-adenosylmethionine ribosyltransferase-isomerase QueA [Dehalococcoidales bacterium]|nr:tRNA preQ1(34) S-adenosylmethionine ribosyltransferase-isomerase QueA [Dehalococcoidales bacterium]